MSPDLYHRRATCRLCKSSELISVVQLTPTPPANAFVAEEAIDQTQSVFPLELFFCGRCHHVQLLDVVNPDYLFRDYVYVSGTSPSFVRHFEEYAGNIIKRFQPKPRALVVDIGSNDGTLLKFFQEQGQTVLGIDPAVAIAKAASDAGIETWPEFFDANTVKRILAEKGKAAVVSANNVFAHADDLAGIADNIRALLAPDGVFVFEVSYLGDVYEDILFDTIYHEHVAYHSVGPLKQFFAAYGLDLFSVCRVSSHGGSIRGLVQIAGGPWRSDESVEALIAHEQALKIDRAETWSNYGEKIISVGERLRGLLSEIKGEGKSVAGFGAPAKATTLMYHFGLGPDIIDFIADDSPLKQGLYSPGLHIPVIPAIEIYQRKPDYLIILAWNFAKPIMDNHKKFRDDGGKFILPLPRVEIY